MQTCVLFTEGFIGEASEFMDYREVQREVLGGIYFSLSSSRSGGSQTFRIRNPQKFAQPTTRLCAPH